MAYELITGKPIRTDHYDFVMSKSGLSHHELTRIRSYFPTHDMVMRSAYSTQPVQVGRQYGAHGDLPWSTLTTTRGTIHICIILIRECADVDTLDYIFFREGAGLVVHRLLRLPPDEIVFSEQALPNRHYCSDHIALVAEFSYKS